MNGNGNREQRSGLLDYLKRAAILRKSKGWQQTIEAARLDQMEILDKIFHLKHFILKESVIAAPHQTLERRQLSSSAVAAGGTEYVEIR